MKELLLFFGGQNVCLDVNNLCKTISFGDAAVLSLLMLLLLIMECFASFCKIISLVLMLPLLYLFLLMIKLVLLLLVLMKLFGADLGRFLLMHELCTLKFCCY